MLQDNQYEQAATVLQQTMDPFAFRAAIDNAYGDQKLEGKNLDGVPHILIEGASGPILTTNFDRVLERAAQRWGRPFETVVEGEQPDRFTKVLQTGKGLTKLHGSWDERQNRVLTSGEYDRAYGVDQVDFSKPLPHFLRTLFTAKSLLFVGCGLEQDRTLKVLLSSVKTMDDGSSHFALLPLPDEEKRMVRTRFLASHHILPVWFP